MQSIKKLRNPDIIEINGKKFQVMDNTSEWWHEDREELEMGIGLIKMGEKSITPTQSLHYIYEKPEEIDSWKFFSWDKKLNEMKEQKIKSIKF